MDDCFHEYSNDKDAYCKKCFEYKIEIAPISIREMCEKIGANLKIDPQDVFNSSKSGELWHIISLYGMIRLTT